MFDAHCAMPPAMLIQFANAIKPYDVLLLEEPAVPGNIEVFKRLKQQIHDPHRHRRARPHHLGVHALPGEPLPGHPAARLLPTAAASRQMKKIATLAEAYFVPLAPHSIMSEVGLSASFQVVAAIPMFLIHEAQLGGFVMPKELIRSTFDVDKDGNAGLPEGPGLGVEIDEAVLAKLAADLRRRFDWPIRIAPDASVYDY